jgi:hypothetical protein
MIKCMLCVSLLRLCGRQYEACTCLVFSHAPTRVFGAFSTLF